MKRVVIRVTAERSDGSYVSTSEIVESQKSWMNQRITSGEFYQKAEAAALKAVKKALR